MPDAGADYGGSAARRGRWVIIGGLIASAGIVATFVFVSLGPNIAFALRAALQLPDDALGFYAVAQPAEALARLAVLMAPGSPLRESLPPGLTDRETYERHGVDLDREAWVALLEREALAGVVSWAVRDNSQALVGARDLLRELMGQKDLPFEERHYDGRPGLLARGAQPVAVFFEDGRVLVVSALHPERLEGMAEGDPADAVARLADRVASVREGGSLADTEAFRKSAMQDRTPDELAYVRVPALIPQELRTGWLGEFDGIAAAWARDGADRILTVKAALTEKSRLPALLAPRADSAALERIAGPALFGIEGRLDLPSLLARLEAGGGGADAGTRDLIEALDGSFGFIVGRLPARDEDYPPRLVAYAGTRDPARTQALLQTWVAAAEAAGIVSVLEPTPGQLRIRPRRFVPVVWSLAVAEGYLWAATDPAELRQIVASPAAGERGAVLDGLGSEEAPVVAALAGPALADQGTAFLDTRERLLLMPALALLRQVEVLVATVTVEERLLRVVFTATVR